MSQSLETRMRDYEAVQSRKLMSNVPVVIRVDGKNFSRITRNFQKPFDPAMDYAMKKAAITLAENLPGTRFAYTQSDEISVILTNEYGQDPLFNYRVDKLTSLAASIATLAFNMAIGRYVSENVFTKDTYKYAQAYDECFTNGAYFDARAFNLPLDEVANYLIWRQNDAARNSLMAAARTIATPSQLRGLNKSGLNEILFANGINWNNYPDAFKRGTFVTRQDYQKKSVYDGTMITRHRWDTVKYTPLISQTREFITNIMR